MAFELHRYQFQQGLKAASQMPPKTPVSLSASQADYVVALSAANVEPFGIIGASAGQAGAVAVYEAGNIVKAIAAASLGYGADVGFASIGVSSQVQGGTTLATTVLLAPVSGASGTVSYRVGKAESPAGAGEVFSVLIAPRQLAGSP